MTKCVQNKHCPLNSRFIKREELFKVQYEPFEIYELCVLWWEQSKHSCQQSSCGYSIQLPFLHHYMMTLQHILVCKDKVRHG